MLGVHELKNKFNSGIYDELFHDELCCDVSTAVKRSCDVLDGFWCHFPNGRCTLFSAPGRTELGGNHTDHQGGCVLAAAVNLDMLCAAAVTENNHVCILSEGFGKIVVDLSIKHPVDEECGTASALVRGMAMWFEERGYNITGINAYITSDVPPGSGMSSSAAFEVLIGTIFNSFFADGAFSKVDIAKAGLYAENVYFGKPCGLMDQLACSVGGLVSINFSNAHEPIVKPLEYDFYSNGFSLCLISTGGSHADLTSEYADITNEMKMIASAFGKGKLSEIDESEILNYSSHLREKCGDRAFLRAVNYFEENRRAQEMAEVLSVNNLSAYLDLVNMSGRGSFMYLQNIYPAGSKLMQPVAVALKAAEIALEGQGAVRVHGGGFAGTIQAYVPNEMRDHFLKTMDKLINPGCCRVLKTRKAGALEITLEK